MCDPEAFAFGLQRIYCSWIHNISDIIIITIHQLHKQRQSQTQKKSLSEKRKPSSWIIRTSSNNSSTFCLSFTFGKNAFDIYSTFIHSAIHHQSRSWAVHSRAELSSTRNLNLLQRSVRSFDSIRFVLLLSRPLTSHCHDETTKE